MTPQPQGPIPSKRVFVRAAILNMVATGQIVIAMRDGRMGWRPPTDQERTELIPHPRKPDVRPLPYS